MPLVALGPLNPLTEAVAMSLWSVLVVWNSLRLQSFTPRKEVGACWLAGAVPT